MQFACSEEHDVIRIHCERYYADLVIEDKDRVLDIPAEDGVCAV